MAPTIDITVNTRGEFCEPAITSSTAVRYDNLSHANVSLTVNEDLAAIERDWRDFEQHADCTVFQTFDWLSTWQRFIGSRNGITPAVVIGRTDKDKILFILPLAIHASAVARELVWLGATLCDYNAPLLATDFSDTISPQQFAGAWQDIKRRLQDNIRTRYDVIRLEKMPAMVGSQSNPMIHLQVTLNPSGAHSTPLTGDWEQFYTGKRSSATRRRDRTKRKRLSEFGEINFVNPADMAETRNALETLMEQKGRHFARMGISNLFAKPGYADFYRVLATDPTSRHLAHVSRLDIGPTVAAVNFGLTFRDCYYHLLASYDDSELSRFGPGAAHLHCLMKYAIDRGLKVFDFTIGDEGYKRDWCDVERKLYDHISVATLRGAVIAAPLVGMHRLKRLIKRTPLLWNTYSKGRMAIAWVVSRLGHRKAGHDHHSSDI